MTIALGVTRGLVIGLVSINVVAAGSAPITTADHGAAGGSSDISGLYREARLEDPRILEAYLRAKSSAENERAAFGTLLPQISANSNFNRSRHENEFARDNHATKSNSLSITQYLYNKGAWESYQKSKSVTKQAGEKANDALDEATLDFAKRYFIALAAEDELELVRAESRATQNSLDRVSMMYERQMAKVTDVLDLKARVDVLRAEEMESVNQIQISREGLSEIIGRSVDERLSRLRSDAALQGPSRPLNEFIDQAIASNPLLKTYQYGAQAAAAAVREGQAGHYPQASLSVSAARSDVGFESVKVPRSDTYVGGIAVSLPVYSGGATSARVRGLKEENIATEQDLEGVRRKIIKETTTAYLTAQSATEKVSAARSSVASAQKSRIAAQKAFSYGVVNSVDVLTSLQNEFKARRDMLKAKYDFVINSLLLDRWSGKLNQQSIDNVNALLSAESENGLPGGGLAKLDSRP
ncbi:TolC family protein [Pseudomonas alloputida]|uniref:TolC family protein n=1 Tax=Pseudomonas alloputida TaxID=1940621 RepID=UPI003D9A82A8